MTPLLLSRKNFFSILWRPYLTDDFFSTPRKNTLNLSYFKLKERSHCQSLHRTHLTKRPLFHQTLPHQETQERCGQSSDHSGYNRSQSPPSTLPMNSQGDPGDLVLCVPSEQAFALCSSTVLEMILRVGPMQNTLRSVPHMLQNHRKGESCN